MGQTLSYGVYLPNEGERNCYAGLASNWQILNTAVGNIAEKAPLVHTHGNITNDGKVGTTANQPLITGTGGVVQAGSFGNTANTFCEGNDSRLSDARTPVAHTHTKSDITDLLNSNFIPSANNSYDLGSSSYQWNNLYAKKTYTSMIKAGTGDLIIQSNGTNKSVAIYNGTDAADGAGIWLYGKDHANGSKVRLQIYNTTTSSYETVDLSGSNFYPVANNLINLGTSTRKWKTLNGINPGALSLPSGGTTENTDWYNVAGDIVPNGGNATDFTGGANLFTPSKDGWLALSVVSCESIAVWVFSLNYGLSVVAPSANDNRQLIIPVVADKQIEIKVKGIRWFSARLIMPRGNI